MTLELTLTTSRSPARAPAAPPLLEIKRVHADAAILSLFRLAPVIDALDIDAPTLRVARIDDGRYDIDDILQRLAAAPRRERQGAGALRGPQHRRACWRRRLRRPAARERAPRPRSRARRSVHQLAAVAARDQGRAASRVHDRRQPLRFVRRGDAVRRARQRRAPRQARRLRGCALPRLLAARHAGAAARGDARHRPRGRLRAAPQALAQDLGHGRRRRASRSSTPPRTSCCRSATCASRSTSCVRSSSSARIKSIDVEAPHLVRAAQRRRPRQPAARRRGAIGARRRRSRAAAADGGAPAGTASAASRCGISPARAPTAPRHRRLARRRRLTLGPCRPLDWHDATTAPAAELRSRLLADRAGDRLAARGAGRLSSGEGVLGSGEATAASSRFQARAIRPTATSAVSLAALPLTPLSPICARARRRSPAS